MVRKTMMGEGTELHEWMSEMRNKEIFQTIPYHYLACHVSLPLAL